MSSRSAPVDGRIDSELFHRTSAVSSRTDVAYLCTITTIAASCGDKIRHETCDICTSCGRPWNVTSHHERHRITNGNGKTTIMFACFDRGGDRCEAISGEVTHFGYTNAQAHHHHQNRCNGCGLCGFGCLCG